VWRENPDPSPGISAQPQIPDEGLGGADRARTDDPLLAKQVLSQLSYSPPRLRPPVIALGLATAESGGSGWIRTIDPRLIKTVL
jgi:hypothetical protein